MNDFVLLFSMTIALHVLMILDLLLVSSELLFKFLYSSIHTPPQVFGRLMADHLVHVLA